MKYSNYGYHTLFCYLDQIFKINYFKTSVMAENEQTPILELEEEEDSSKLQKYENKELSDKLKQSLEKAASLKDTNAVLDLDVEFFCESALNSSIAEIGAAKPIFILDQLLETIKGKEDEEMVKKAGNLRYFAGICLYDLANNKNWNLRIINKQKHFIDETCKTLIELDFDDYSSRNLQAKILARFLLIAFVNQKELMTDLIEEVTEKISDGEFNQIDAALRSLIYFIEKVEDEDLTKDFYEYVPEILNAILSAFTNEEIGSHGREQVLHILYLCLRCISWADGIDNELVENCLNETFNQWMAVFLQVIQSDAKKLFDIKRNALKCLTVIFRDFINYSRECISMILKPAWKLMNMHLPIFTEVLGYNMNIKEIKKLDEEENSTQDDQERGYESEEDDEMEEPHGIKGMTLQLIELLTTLVQRPNVQEVVRQGINPLLMTVSSYMVIEFKDQREHLVDENFFLYDKTQSIYKTRTIKNQCVDLFSSLIEIFGDQAITSIILVINNLLDLKVETINFFPSPEQLEESKEGDEVQIAQDLKEYSYMSLNPNHIWKRKDVAMILLGIFIEDIQMYCIRNPKFNLTKLIQEIVRIEFQNSGKMSSYLKGRSLWCASTCAESLIFPDIDTQNLKSYTLDLSINTLQSEKTKSIKLVATRTLVKFARKIHKETLQENAQKFEGILDDLLELLDTAQKEVMHLPIEAFQTFSKVNQETVSQMAPKITPKLLKIFKAEHSEGNLGQELINLFKQWCQYDDCRDIFINTFIPFIMEIIESYYNSTPNEENKDSQLQLCSVSESLSIDSSNEKLKPTQDQKVLSVVDSTILQHVLDLLCTLLKRTDREKHPEEFKKIVDVFPQLMNFVKKSEDMFLLLHGTAALKNFIFVGYREILAIVNADQIIDVAKKLLQPTTNEQAAMCLGNLIIQIFHKIQPKIDTSVLFCVVQKIYKTRMPSTLQSLVLIYARLIQTNPTEIVELLSDTSVDNRISLKVVLDKWLLQQPLFRGPYTKIVTLTALQKLFMMRDSRIESLMVIGYNPSHSNINSEVNAPFKILSTLLRFLENETQNPGGGNNTKYRAPVDGDPYGDSPKKGGAFGDFEMPRRNNLRGGGERLDTMEGQYDLYDDEDDDSNQGDSGIRQEFDDDDSDFEGDEVDLFGSEKKAKKKNKKGLNTSQEKIEVNLDDIEDDDDQECLLDYKQNEMNIQKIKSPSKDKNDSSSDQQFDDTASFGSINAIDHNLFKIKESQDKGLADMETGSEVYMSELLAGFDMEDFDEADEQNEEDLMLLGDSFAKITDLKSDIINRFKEFIQSENYAQGKEYVQYCVKQLHEDDQLLAKQFLLPLFKKDSEENKE